MFLKFNKSAYLTTLASGFLSLCLPNNAVATSIVASQGAVKLESNSKRMYKPKAKTYGLLTVTSKPLEIVPSSTVTNSLNQFYQSLPAQDQWTFTSGGSLPTPYEYSRYSVCIQQMNGCGVKDDQGAKFFHANPDPASADLYPNSVGIEFQLKYRESSILSPTFPGSLYDDNTRLTDQGFNWLQTVQTNFGVITGGNDQYVDNKSHPDTPFYGAGGYIDSIAPNIPFDNPPFYFEDAPQRRSLDKDKVSWKGQVFLAKKTGLKSVTIYDGVSWGWDSMFIPEKNNNKQARQSPVIGPILPGIGVDALTSCPSDASFYHPCSIGALDINPDDVEQDNSYFVTDPTEQTMYASTKNAEPVPTPALLPGMMATGIYHGRKWRKRKQQKSNSDNIAA